MTHHLSRRNLNALLVTRADAAHLERPDAAAFIPSLQPVGDVSSIQGEVVINLVLFSSAIENLPAIDEDAAEAIPEARAIDADLITHLGHDAIALHRYRPAVVVEDRPVLFVGGQLDL